MNLNEYQKAARGTAVYLELEGSRMIYPALGLIGECGEVAEKIKKLIRDDNGEITPERRESVKKELGDVMWYVANICCDTDLDLEMIYRMRTALIMDQMRKLTLPQLVIHMNRFASMAAGILDHWFHKYSCCLTKTGNFRELPRLLTEVVVCIEETGNRFDLTFQDIYIANLEKLLSRQKRGKIRGSGDSR